VLLKIQFAKRFAEDVLFGHHEAIEGHHSGLLTLFIGICLGVFLGLYPFSFGSMTIPVRLGLAGGPLIAAIVLSGLGRVGPLVWFMPRIANLAIRELGITLFLACVGLKAGEHFFDVLLTHEGLVWVASGAVITLAPLLLAAWVGGHFMKLNFINICGVISGSMTDPPGLAFANAINRSDAPSVAYATVYPLTMLLRVIVAQLLVVFFVK
jgi:putative transport protein